ncbi:MAG: PQQ-binding-like beta-propeller repeat protein [Planctomycetaceae bacterium]
MKTASGWILAPVLFVGGACVAILFGSAGRVTPEAAALDRVEPARPDRVEATIANDDRFVAAANAREAIARMNVRPGDWPQFGGWPSRNNVPDAHAIPENWDVDDGTNIKWTAQLGSQSYGNPVVANGRVYVGTNNRGAYLPRYPEDVDLGVVLCFDEATGKFLWQHSNEKLAAGRVQDWPAQGVCSAVYADGDRLWYVSNRCEVVCLDALGFQDDENDGPFRNEPNEDRAEADVVWKFDMIGKLGVHPHNMSTCSVTCAGDILLVCTSNGMDESHIRIPAPHAPSFIGLDRRTGKLLWSDNTPGAYILHGQWSSPAFGVIAGVPQAIFAGGDGWVYSFHPEGDGRGESRLLWKFDANPKASKWILGGRGTRNNIIATPVIHDGRVLVAVGQDPEHGEGIGGLWCIDPTKRGDVSSELVLDAQGEPIRVRRGVVPADGDRIVPNPNSAAVWHYTGFDLNGDGRIDFEETMHRTLSTPAIADGRLYVPDFSGLVHCVDVTTGRPHWTHDMFAAVWSSPLIADGKVYVGDEDGDVTVFAHSSTLRVIAETNMNNSIYTTPIVANGVLYIANKSKLFAIAEK